MPCVLVVDDDDQLLRALATGLRVEGFNVLPARDAGTALTAVADAVVDLALLDLMMPGINGIQLARSLRERYPRIRVVLTSSYHLSEPQLVRADCGAVGFVPKPYDLGELARFLRSKLRGPPAELPA